MVQKLHHSYRSLNTFNFYIYNSVMDNNVNIEDFYDSEEMDRRRPPHHLPSTDPQLPVIFDETFVEPQNSAMAIEDFNHVMPMENHVISNAIKMPTNVIRPAAEPESIPNQSFNFTSSLPHSNIQYGAPVQPVQPVRPVQPVQPVGTRAEPRLTRFHIAGQADLIPSFTRHEQQTDAEIVDFNHSIRICYDFVFENDNMETIFDDKNSGYLVEFLPHSSPYFYRSFSA